MEKDKTVTGIYSDSYNDRIFKSGFRKIIHEKRFIWLINKITGYQIPYKTIVELGCFDAKTIDFLPEKPLLFVGYDANWENGLDLAKEKWNGYSQYQFHKSLKPDDIKEARRFDLAICMETLEHLNAAEEMYIQKLAGLTEGYLLVSVPNETGIVFLIKHVYKALFQKKDPLSNYTLKDVFYLTLGLTKKVIRNQHKGFSYQNTIRLIAKDFKIIKKEGIQFKALPLWLNFTIGIVAKKI